MADFSKWLIFALEEYKLAKEILKQPGHAEMSACIKAKDVFLKLEKELTLFKQEEAVSQISLLSSLLNYETALIFVKLGQCGESKEYFQKSWDLIKEQPSRPDYVMLALSIASNFGKMWKDCNEKLKAWEYFELTYHIHCEFKLSLKPCLAQFEDLFLNTGERQAKLKEENLILLENYMLKNKILNEYFKGDFIHYRLSKLKCLLSSAEFDQFAWALDCFCFSSYFIGANKFPMARYVLCCAKKMADNYETTFTTIESKNSDQWQWLSSLKIFIANQWVSYIAQLIKVSYTIVKNTETVDVDLDGLFNMIVINDELYALFDEKDVKEYENQISCGLAHNYEDARALFLFGQDQFKLCQSHDLYQTELMMHVKLLVDFSSLYDSLSKFETDKDRLSKMYKREIDLLESAFGKVDYDIWPDMYKRIIHDLGSLYYDANRIKHQKLISRPHEASNYGLNKIRRLKNKAIYYLELNIQFYKDENVQIDKIVSEVDLYSILSSYVKLAQLFLQLPPVTFEDKKIAAQNYKFVINYINKKPYCEKYIKDCVTFSDVKTKYSSLITEINLDTEID